MADSEELLRRAPVVADPVDRAMARARAEAALFGDAPAAVKVGRFTILERAGAGGMGVVWSAWDPELDRRVALKLATAGDARARARARVEGQALAKLSHPHVVPIYDVLDAPEGVFLVIELVRGDTLRAYAKASTVPAVIRAYRQAGEGLAAAHAEGLVHRDFKPDNAIVGADGRVRVLDFGLAGSDGSDDRTGGTAGYMAPEQVAGGAVTVAVDQFALCVSLREGLEGRVPRWVAPILERGTDADPAKRYPSMTALLGALALDPATRWRRRALVGVGVAGVATTALAFALGKSEQPVDPCAGAEEAIAASWGPERQAAAAVHAAALPAGYARQAAPTVATTLDGYATGWASLHLASCRAHQRGELTVVSFDRRLACLAIRRAALATVGELLTGIVAEGVPDLIVAAGNLPELAVCGRDDLLASPVEPPPLPKAREAAAIAALLAQVEVQRDAGKTEPATLGADTALQRARVLGYEPLIARAELARGRIELVLSRGDRGAALFREALLRALRVDDEALAVEAFARGAWAAGTTGTRDATDGLPLVEAITDRIGEREPFVRALLHNNLGSIALARGDRPAARSAFERARREATTLHGPGAIELTVVPLNLLLVTEDPESQIAFGRELVAQRTRLLGVEHPLTLEARIAVSVYVDAPDARAQLGAACFALRDLHPDHRELLGECMYELAWLAVLEGDLATVATATTAGAAAYAPSEEQHGVLVALGLVARSPAEALAVLARAPALPVDAPWWRTSTALDATIAGALAHRALHDQAAVQRDVSLARALLARISSAVLPVTRQRRQRLLDLL